MADLDGNRGATDAGQFGKKINDRPFDRVVSRVVMLLIGGLRAQLDLADYARGRVKNRLAAGNPDLAAAVPYYGIQPPADLVSAIRAPLLLQYAETDENINKGIAAYEAALKANNKTYTLHVYPGTQHAFNNDTGAARYNKEAADLAWDRTLAFLKEKLGAPPKAS